MDCLPLWIQADPVFERMHRSVRCTLCTMAAAGSPTTEGHVLNILGGKTLSERTHFSARTLRRHIDRLRTAGFVVVMEAGGPGPEAKANIYGIPAARGVLDEIAERPLNVVQVRMPDQTDRLGRQKYVPRRVREGGQLCLFEATEPPTPLGQDDLSLRSARPMPLGQDDLSPLGQDDLPINENGMNEPPLPPQPAEPLGPELAEAAELLERIGWRAEMGRHRWRALVVKEREHILACVEQYRVRAAQAGDPIQAPPAYFETLFKNKRPARRARQASHSRQTRHPSVMGSVATPIAAAVEAPREAAQEILRGESRAEALRSLRAALRGESSAR